MSEYRKMLAQMQSGGGSPQAEQTGAVAQESEHSNPQSKQGRHDAGAVAGEE